jgi:hypothetical protein
LNKRRLRAICFDSSDLDHHLINHCLADAGPAMSKRQQVAFNFFATLAVVSCLAATGHACLASKPAKTSQHAQLQHEELQTGQQHHQQRALQAALGDAASVRALLSSTQQHTVAGTHPSAEQGSQRMLAAGGSKGQRHSGVAVVNDIPGHFEVGLVQGIWQDHALCQWIIDH